MTELRTITMESEPMPLGHGRAVIFRLIDGQLEAEWKPRIPHGPWASRLLPAYRRARQEFLRRVALKTGLNMLVVEL
ncbi:hypothetical protein [Sphingomonas kyungheensis]|uniref:Uncharacterized protein n=1 Tax=Sphingomonas kyungheensis TaxID=1069987 RepID=A0ABU8GX06_9SPHN